MGVKGDKAIDVVAKSAGADASVLDPLKGGAGVTAQKTLESGKQLDLPGFPRGYTAIARALDGYGDGRRGVVVAVVRPEQRNLMMTLLYPMLGAVVLGLILCAVAGFFLDAYISKPILEIEEGLLAIINGQTNRRLDLEHPVFGGVVFRINSLLNQLFGVAEDDTDEQGRPSRSPEAGTFNEALSVDESVAMGQTTAHDAEVLHQTAEGEYYGGVYRDYIAAKKQIGDPTDHITEADFTARLKQSEGEMAAKHGKPTRFKVELKGKEVVLVAVPLG
jgi:hypothetical protein